MQVGDGRSAIVTEVSSQIGRAVALSLLRLGWKVAGFGADPEVLAELSFEGGDQFVGFRYDLAIPSRRARLLAKLRAELPSAELLINNLRDTTGDEPISAWSARAELVEAVLPILATSSAPMLINVQPLRAPNEAPSPFRTAFVRMGEVLERELEPRGIRVTNLGPASLEHPSVDQLVSCIEWLVLAPKNVRVAELAVTQNRRPSAPEPHLRLLPGLHVEGVDSGQRREPTG